MANLDKEKQQTMQDDLMKKGVEQMTSPKGGGGTGGTPSPGTPPSAPAPGGPTPPPQPGANPQPPVIKPLTNTAGEVPPVSPPRPQMPGIRVGQ